VLRLQRPSAGPLPLHRALAARLRRLDPRRTMRRLATGLFFLLLVNLGVHWRATIDGLGQRRAVATMLRSVPAGSVIDEADVTFADWPVDLIPDGSSAHLPIGEIASSDLVRGEVVLLDRLFPTPDGLDIEERLITVPQPLAPPPLHRGTRVELYGIMAIGDGFTTPATRLANGVVFDVTESSVAVVVDNASVPTIIEHLAAGTIDIVIQP